MTREEAIEIVKSAFSAWESEFRVPNDDWSEEHEALDMAIEALKNETILSADRPRGKWIIHGEPPWYVRECSECGAKWHQWSGGSNPNYCGNCGAKMDGERSEE